MSKDTESKPKEYEFLSKALHDEFGVPTDKTSELIKAIPLIFQGMQISDAYEFIDIPTLLKGDELSATEKKIFEGIEEDALEKALAFVNSYVDFIPTAVSYGDAWDWSKADIDWPEDNRIKAVADFLLTDYLTRKYTKNLAVDTAARQKIADSSKLLMYDTIDMEMTTDSINVQDGVLTGKTVMTAAMVQEYKRDDGTVQKVLKCPDELKLAVDFCRQIPCTDGHPPARVVDDPDQIKGWTGIPKYNDTIRRVETDVEITDPALVKKVQDGKRDVSIGFICELDETKGKFKDNDNKEHEYDAVQRKMILNHLAVGIDSGRCPGHVCGIGIDSAMVPVTDAADNANITPTVAAIIESKKAADAKKATDAKVNATCLKCGRKQSAETPVHEQKCIECNQVGTLRQMTEQAMTGGGLDEKTALGELIDMDALTLADEELAFDDVVAYIYDSFELESTDAVLTTAQRKELPDDVFCGPNRSFPVPDCAHVTAARRLIGRYKGPGSKDAILACVDKRAKELNCSSTGDNDGDSTDEGDTGTPTGDGDVSAHEKLLKEKTDAIKTLAKKLDNVANMDVKDVQAVISQIDTIVWDLSKTVAIVQTAKIGVDETVMTDAKDTFLLGFKLIADNKLVTDSETGAGTDQPRNEAERAMAHFNITLEQWNSLTPEEQAALIAQLPPRGTAGGARPGDNDNDPDTEAEDNQNQSEGIDQEDIDEAYEFINQEKIRKIDAIMDFKPLKPRSHYEDMTHKTLDEIYEAYMLQKKERDTSDSSSKATSVDAAYEKIQNK